MTRRAWLGAVVAMLCVGASARVASAHAVSLSHARYRVEGATLVGQLVFSSRELAAALPSLDRDHDGLLAEAELSTDVLARTLVSPLAISADGRACVTTFDSVKTVADDGVELAITARCPAPPRRIAMHVGFLDRLASGHRHLVSLDSGGEAVATWAAPDVTLADASFRALFALGVEHILTGWDHLVFLLGLVIAGGRVRALVVALTAFTLAHSISLALATLGVVAPSPAYVEPLIALSIAWIGVENLVRARRADDPARRRWLVTFPFGLVHGFGFAGALVGIGLARARIPRALFAFNLGVEVGQLAVLAVALPLVSAIATRSWFARGRGRLVGNVAIAVAGAALFVVRLWT